MLLSLLNRLELLDGGIPNNAFLAVLKDQGQVSGVVAQYSATHGVQLALSAEYDTTEARLSPLPPRSNAVNAFSPCTSCGGGFFLRCLVYRPWTF